MVPTREHPASSEARLIVDGDEQARIAFSLNQAESHVTRMPPSPTKRRLTAALEFFRHTVENWKVCAPEDEELELLREHVAEVLHLATTSSPTVKMRRPA
jgi:hypothetical protein